MTTIDDIRRTNLARLANELGGNKRLALAVGVSESQMAQWVRGAKESKTGKPRGLRLSSCHRIEDKTGKPRGWLDTPLSSAPTAMEPPRRYAVDEPRATPALRTCLEVFVDALTQLSPARAASVKAQIDLVIGQPAMRDDVLNELRHLLDRADRFSKLTGTGN